MNFPPEVCLQILLYVDDTDLQTMLRLNRAFRALASDSILWLHLRFNSQLKIEQKLKNRPSFENLVQTNIVKTGNPLNLLQSIANGSYSQVFVHNQYSIERLLRLHQNQRVLNRLLQTRPSPGELPISLPISIQASPSIQPKAFNYAQIVQKQRLQKLLSKGQRIDRPFANVSRKIAQTQIVLKQKLLRRELNEKFVHRRNVEALVRMNIIPERFMLCPDIRGKIRFFEGVSTY